MSYQRWYFIIKSRPCYEPPKLLKFTRQVKNLPAFGAWLVLISDPATKLELGIGYLPCMERRAIQIYAFFHVNNT